MLWKKAIDLERSDSDLAVRTCVLRAVGQGEIVVNDIRNRQNLGNEIF